MLRKDGCCRSAREVYDPSTKPDVNWPTPSDLLLGNGDQEGKRCASNPSWEAQHASSDDDSDDEIDDWDEHHPRKNDGCDSVQH
jgi:hypothetical protein